MTRGELVRNINHKRSYLCIGLDSDIRRIPEFLHREKDPIFKFNQEIIAATSDLCVAYKPNIAFYESLGSAGWKSLEDTISIMPDDIFTIADAKRGDIGNTSKLYARAFFENMNFDSVTVAPYMGEDSVAPFLEFDDKWVILLGLTSNKGSADFQHLNMLDNQPLYKQVIRKAQAWGNPDNLMFVVGATQAQKIKEVRSWAEDYFFLVPGVGAQGGSVSEVSTQGKNKDIGLLINSSRSIIYASSGKDFAEKAREKAQELVDQMSSYI